MSIVNGSEITVVSNNEAVRGVFEVFLTPPHGGAPDYFRWRDTDNVHVGGSRLEDEGITWIRGWHGAGSEELLALLAAHRLNPLPQGATGPTGAPGCTGNIGPRGPKALRGSPSR